MGSNFTPFRRKIAALTLASFVVQLAPVAMFNQAFAFAGSFTPTQMTANVTAGADMTQDAATLTTTGATAVQSVTTFTIATPAVDTNTLTIDDCTITFTDNGPDELDCTNGNAVIDSVVNNDAALQATAIQGINFTNFAVSAGGVGEFILTHDTTAVNGNPSSNEVGMTVTEAPNTVGVLAVAQQNTITVGGTIEIGDIFTANLPGAVTASFTAVDTDANNVATGLNAAILSSTGYAGQAFTSGVATNVITLTAKVAGVGFTQTSGTTNRPAVAQVVDFTPTAPNAGETYRATINGTDYDHTVVGVQTVQQVVEGLQVLMDADGAVTCSEDNTKVTCTADAAGTAFTFAATMVDITAPVTSEVTPVPALTNDSTPSYTFTTGEAGTLSYGGDCSSAATTAATGSNMITFNALADGLHNNCTITVTDGSANASIALAVTQFTVDTTAPVVTEVTPIATPGNDTTPNYEFSTTQNGSITYGGACTSGTALAATGSNTVTLSALGEGSYTGCTITVTDSATNVSNTLTIPAFTIDTTAPGVVLTTGAPNPTNGTFTVTATFTEVVTGLAQSDFVVTNGTPSAFATLSGSAYSVLVTPTTDGDVTVDMAASAGADLAGNNSTVATQIGRTYDATAPVLTEVTPIATPGNDTTPDYVFSATENGSITYGGACTSGTALAATGSNTITLSALGEGSYTGCTITVTDSATNVSNTLTIPAFTIDTTAPGVVLTTGAPNPTNGTFTVTATFDQAVTGVLVGDFAVTNGTPSAFNPVSSTVYTALITPTGDGIVDIDMAASAAQDLAGNNSTVATQLTRTFDGTAPVLTELTPITTPGNDPTPDYVFSTTENGSITYGGACTSITALAATGSNTITFSTLVQGSYTGCTITVTDSATNVSNTLTIPAFTINTTAPTVVLSSTGADPLNGAFSVTATFSAIVTGFVSGDVTLGNGSISNFAGTGTTYTFDVTPTTDGLVTIDVAGSVAQDDATNNNTAATQLTRMYDAIAPVIVEVTPIATPANDTTPDYVFSGSQNGSITYGGACTSITALAATGSNTITLSALAEGSYTGCTITVTDSATNVSNTLTIPAFTIDTTAPTIVIGATPLNVNSGATSALTFTLSQESTTFDSTDVVVAGGTLSAFAGSGTSYTATFTPTASSTMDGTIDVAGSAFTDLAGNNNTAATQVIIAVDTVDPVISEVTAVPSLTNDSTPNYTFTTSESGSITYGGGCSSATTIASTGSNTITLTSLTSATYTGCTVVVTDAAGNPSNTLTLTTFVIDTIAPTATIAYSPMTSTSGSVTTTLTGVSESIVVTNNSGFSIRTFSSTGTFLFLFSDLAGNTGSALANVTNIDTEAPVVTLNGSGSINIAWGTPYSDAGATWTDNVDGSGSVTASGSVNFAAAGTYTLTYTKTDVAGNVGTGSRSVTVGPQPAGGGGGGGGGSSSSMSIGTPTATVVSTGTTTVTTTVTPKPIKKPIVRKPIVKKPVIVKEFVPYSLFAKDSRVNIRLAADANSKFLGYISQNTKVLVTAEDGTWIKVETLTISGWAKKSQFRSPNEKEAQVIKKDAERVLPYVLYTNQGRINVWSEANFKSKFLGYFDRSGIKVEVIATRGEWIQVKSKIFNGWAKKSQFRDPKNNEDATIILAK